MQITFEEWAMRHIALELIEKAIKTEIRMKMIVKEIGKRADAVCAAIQTMQKKKAMKAMKK
jgi:hypothetical protein